MTELEQRVRLFIYRFVIQHDRCPTLNEIADQAGVVPIEAQEMLERLESDASAIVLSPRTGNLWLADPFAAMPTPYPVEAEGHRWFGMCVWDALGILALTGFDGQAPTRCPISGEALTLAAARGKLTQAEGIVHFAVPAADWWQHIGFT